MTDKYQNKYRIASTRLKNWDYGGNGAYFITICTRDRVHYFGEITHGRMVMSEIGRMAEKFWKEIPVHFPHVRLDEFVIMPNHVHGIIIIDKHDDRGKTVPVMAVVETPKLIVETPKLGVSTTMTGNDAKSNTKKWKPGNLGVIINQYKRICTIRVRKINPDFAWQYRFYDHVIRNDRSFQRIVNYIRNNPDKWKDDRFHH